MKNLLVIGSGGREHAIILKFKQSPNVAKIYALPGNAGIAELAQCVSDVKVTDHQEIIDFCQKKQIDLVFIGPEQPLVDGLVDDLEKNQIKVFGPSKFAAQLEGSKAFMKEICRQNNIPTAKYQIFQEQDLALKFCQFLGFPCVIKADGLAAGKGVVITGDESEAKEVITEFFAGKFGEAGKKIVIEEFLTGQEVSYFAISDGCDFISLGSACDHKKVGENETGPNTGGMGTFSPAPFITKEIEAEVINKIIKPTIDAMKSLGHPFIGILFAGLILTKDGPKLLEFNTRFGDPETQVILPRIKSDFFDLISAAIESKIKDFKVTFDEEKKLVAVVVAAKGYPDSYEKGSEIKNLASLKNLKNVEILHAGTILKDDKILSNGGRVLNIVANANNFKTARHKAYEAFKMIEWQDGFVRYDIAKKVEDF
jgi:phosphoribosylamine--glycine ligase